MYVCLTVLCVCMCVYDCVCVNNVQHTTGNRHSIRVYGRHAYHRTAGHCSRITMSMGCTCVYVFLWLRCKHTMPPVRRRQCPIWMLMFLLLLLLSVADAAAVVHSNTTQPNGRTHCCSAMCLRRVHTNTHTKTHILYTKIASTSSQHFPMISLLQYISRMWCGYKHTNAIEAKLDRYCSGRVCLPACLPAPDVCGRAVLVAARTYQPGDKKHAACFGSHILDTIHNIIVTENDACRRNQQCRQLCCAGIAFISWSK